MSGEMMFLTSWSHLRFLMLEYGVHTLLGYRITELWVLLLIFQMVLCWVFSTTCERHIFLMFVRWWLILTSCGNLIYRMIECR